MAKVLPDPELTEFLRSRWSQSTAFRRQEMIESVVDFLQEHQGVEFVSKAIAAIAPECDCDEFDDDDCDCGDIDEVSEEVSTLKRRVALIEKKLADKK